VAGEAMALRSVLVILGMSNPFVVLFTSNIALALALLPSVLMLSDWEIAVNVVRRHMAIVESFFILTDFTMKIANNANGANRQNGVFNKCKLTVFYVE
jgi:hypothetical protein